MPTTGTTKYLQSQATLALTMTLLFGTSWRNSALIMEWAWRCLTWLIGRSLTPISFLKVQTTNFPFASVTLQTFLWKSQSKEKWTIDKLLESWPRSASECLTTMTQQVTKVYWMITLTSLEISHKLRSSRWTSEVWASHLQSTQNSQTFSTSLRMALRAVKRRGVESVLCRIHVPVILNYGISPLVFSMRTMKTESLCQSQHSLKIRPPSIMHHARSTFSIWILRDQTNTGTTRSFSALCSGSRLNCKLCTSPEMTPTWSGSVKMRMRSATPMLAVK